MKNVFYLFAICFTIGFSGKAQLNDYKYIVVPKQFETFDRQNQYQTSTLLKYLFNSNGYTAIYDDAFPDDLENNGCLALKADLDNNPSLFATRVSITLKDCNGQVVFTSLEGRTKEKEYKTAYDVAIRKAFKSFEILNYEYSPKEEVIKEEPIIVSFKNDVKSLEADREVDAAVDNEKEPEIIKQEATLEKQSAESEAPTNSVMKESSKNNEGQGKLEVLYAQPIDNGFQLVDSTPKVQYKLIETSVENIFLATHGDTNGVVLKKDGKWFFEYSSNGIKVLEELKIKF